MKAPCKLVRGNKYNFTFFYFALPQKLATFKMVSKKTANPYTYWILCAITAEIIEWFIDDQAFSLLYGLAPAPPLPSPGSMLDRQHTVRLRKRDNWWQTGEGGGRGSGRSRIIRRRESLVFYKSFNDLCCNSTENPIGRKPGPFKSCNNLSVPMSRIKK